jgi:hypothetical protein
MLCSLPAAAQSDIVGFWNQPAIGTALGPGIAALFGFEEDSTERADGPALVDYLGIPLNEEARAREVADKLRVPPDAMLGGAETAYPEYRDRLRRAR